MNGEMEQRLAQAFRLEEEGTAVPALSWDAVRARAATAGGLRRHHRLRWPWVVAASLVVATAGPVAAVAPLQQAVLQVLGGQQEDPGLYAAATGGNWQLVHMVSAAGGYALACSGYYYDGYETAILCDFTVPPAVARAHAGYGPFVPVLQLTDSTGKALSLGMAEGAGPGHAMLYIFHGTLRPGVATLRVTGLPTAPAGVPVAAQPQFPPLHFALHATTSTPAVIVRQAGADTLHGIRVSVAEFVSSPGMTHVTLHWAVTNPKSGMRITGQPVGRGTPPLLVRPDGQWLLGLALRTLGAGTLPFHGGSSGPSGGTGDFDTAPGVQSFTVEVPRLAVTLPGGVSKVLSGPWVIPVHLPR